jgi:hypothetical protein
MTLLKNVTLWDGSPPGSAGVSNLFGLSPPGCQLVGEKTPNKLGTPTGDAFFNRIIDIEQPGMQRFLSSEAHRSILCLTGITCRDIQLPFARMPYDRPQCPELALRRVHPVRANKTLVVTQGLFHVLRVYQLVPPKQLAETVVAERRIRWHKALFSG